MGIINSKNVRSEFAAAYRVSAPPRFEKKGPFNGNDGEFFRVDYVLPVVEVYPSDDGSRQRDIRIGLTSAQAKVVLDNMENDTDLPVKMHTNSALGTFVLSAAKAGVKPDIDDDDMEDQILVLSSSTETRSNGWRDTKWTVKAYLGTANSFDPEKARTVVDGYNEGSKQTSETAY